MITKANPLDILSIDTLDFPMTPFFASNILHQIYVYELKSFYKEKLDNKSADNNIDSNIVSPLHKTVSVHPPPEPPLFTCH